jgi:hypothetical protein
MDLAVAVGLPDMGGAAAAAMAVAAATAAAAGKKGQAYFMPACTRRLRIRLHPGFNG